MNTPKEIIDEQPQRVRKMFLTWIKFMEDNVDFWQIPGDLDIHTQGHCERVLMHALRIGEARHATDRQMLALAHASIFHDTRRKDNYLDTGHGARAAEHYATFQFKIQNSKLNLNSQPSTLKAQSSKLKAQSFVPLPEACVAIWYHDRDDEVGEDYIRQQTKTESERESWLEVYRDFKDADGLDRLRLGTWCLDPKFLRTPEAKTMIPFAQKLVEATIPPAELQRTYNMTNPFRPDK